MSLKNSLLLAAALLVPSFARADLLVKDGQSVAFLGDSITQQGWETPGGYVKLVVAGFATLGVHITPIPAGISGQTSQDMLARIGDVIDKKPDWMTLSCGVNDVWHGATGVELEPYKKNITEIVDKCTAAGIKVLIMTASVIGEDLPNANNQKLAAYNDWLRDFAKQRNLPVADENAAFQHYINTTTKRSDMPNLLTMDGVHPIVPGHELMAQTILEGFGATPDDIAKVKAAWLDLPASAATHFQLNFDEGPITLREYQKLLDRSAASHVPLQTFGDQLFLGALEDAIKTHAADNPPATPDALRSDAFKAYTAKIDAL